jgi:hypothetical protein
MYFNTVAFLEVERPILFDWLILVVLVYSAVGLWRNRHARTATERIARRGAIREGKTRRHRHWAFRPGWFPTWSRGAP